MTLFDSVTNQPVSRRRFLKAGAVGAAGLVLYSSLVERHWIDVTRIEIPLRGLSAELDGLRVVQLSDIHLDEYTEPFFLRRAVAKINELAPDAVFLTGDFVSEGPLGRKFARSAAWQCANLLDALECRKRYAVLGNHDVMVGKDAVAEALTANGICVLDNACLPMERGGGRLWLAGVDDPLAGHPKPALAIPAAIRGVAGEPVILLCHGPDFADELLKTEAGRAVSLMLSGHTHGGQVRLPWLGATELPELGRKYVEGLFRLGGMQLYVNRGIGTVGLPFRFNCPPEITVLTLRRG